MSFINRCSGDFSVRSGIEDENNDFDDGRKQGKGRSEAGNFCRLAFYDGCPNIFPRIPRVWEHPMYCSLLPRILPPFQSTCFFFLFFRYYSSAVRHPLLMIHPYIHHHISYPEKNPFKDIRYRCNVSYVIYLIEIILCKAMYRKIVYKNVDIHV